MTRLIIPVLLLTLLVGNPIPILQKNVKQCD